MRHGEDPLCLVTGHAELAIADAPQHLAAEPVDVGLDALGGIAAGLHSAMGRSGVIEERPEIGK